MHPHKTKRNPPKKLKVEGALGLPIRYWYRSPEVLGALRNDWGCVRMHPDGCASCHRYHRYHTVFTEVGSPRPLPPVLPTNHGRQSDIYPTTYM